MIIDRIAPLDVGLFVEQRADLKSRAIGIDAVGLVTVRNRLLAEQIDARRNTVAEEGRVGGRQIDAARVLTIAEGGLHGIAGAVEIAVAQLDLAKPSVGCRVTAGKVEVA